MKVIELPFTLKWEEEKKEAEKLSSLFFAFKLDFLFSLFDERQGKIHELTLEHFTTTFYPLFETKTEGVILYRGTFDLAFPWTLEEEERFISLGKRSPFHRKAFKKNNMVDYFTLLTAKLPVDLPVFLIFEDPFFPTEESYLLAELSYTPFTIVAPNATLNIPLYSEKPAHKSSSALLLPPAEVIDPSFLQTLDLTSHRLIPESALTHNWEGIDTLFVYDEYLTESAKRKLLGFEAAGGKVDRLKC